MVLRTLENLENLEKSGNFILVRENLENLEKSGNFAKISPKILFQIPILRYFQNILPAVGCFLNFSLHLLPTLSFSIKNGQGIS